MKFKFIFMILSVTGLLIVSCSKDNNTTTSTTFDASQLISMTEANVITAENYTIAKSSEETTIGLKMSDYSTTDDGLFQVALTQTAAINGAGLKVAKDYYTSMKTVYPTNVEVTGIGDEAFIHGNFIYILYTDDYYISVCVLQKGIFTDPGRWTAAQLKNFQIASGKKAVENLKVLLK